jgi:hypothetical protein
VDNQWETTLDQILQRMQFFSIRITTATFQSRAH